MPLPNVDLMHIQVGGAVGGSERWSFGTWYELNGMTTNPVQADMDALATQVMTWMNTFWTTLKAKNASGVTFDSVRVLVYRAGIIRGSAEKTQAGVAGTGTAPLPGYVARVITLKTDSAGRSYRGRMYIPYTGVGTSAGTLQWASDSGTLAAWKTFNGSIIGGVLPLPGGPSALLRVVSKALGVATVVTAASWDSIPDSQHGRTRKFVAAAVDSVGPPW